MICNKYLLCHNLKYHNYHHYRSEVAEEEGAVVAGINGFTLESETNKIAKEAKTFIQAKHSWALLLNQNSTFRRQEEEN